MSKLLPLQGERLASKQPRVSPWVKNPIETTPCKGKSFKNIFKTKLK